MANISLQKPILESVWQNAEYLTDNNYKNYTGKTGFAHSRWPTYLTLDLQDIHEVETIRFLLWNNDQRVYKYRLLTSTDFLSWHVHFDGSDTGFKGWQEFSFPEKISVRYVRIHCLWNSANLGYHIVQLQVYDKDTEQLDEEINNKRVLLLKTNEVSTEIRDGLPLTQKMNNLTNSLETILKEHSIINPEPFKEIIANFRVQAHDIESLEKSIDSIRREIINPVKEELEEGKRLGKFSKWGFYIGFIGFIVSIFAILNGIFNWI